MSKKAISGEVQMFGMSEDAIREQYMNSITAKFSGLEMVVAGILSDVQETLPAGDRSMAKQLNVAKFILFEMMNAKETR
jgi:hypothetical protein